MFKDTDQQIPEKTKIALKWITDILKVKNIPYQISGGFSAKLYGSPRPLNDIDIDIPDDKFEDILEDVRPYLIYGPDHYENGKWDLRLMTLDYKGQEIDIGGGDNAKVSNKERTKWIGIPTDFSKYVDIAVDGIEIRVIPPDELIEYKKNLDGDHQKVDIEAAQKYMNQ